MKINTKKITAVGLATLMFGMPISAFADDSNTTLDVNTSAEVDTTDLEEEILEVEVESEVEVETEVEEEVESEVEEELDEEEREHFLTKEGAQLRWEQLTSRLGARVENAKTLISEIPEDSEIDSELLTDITIDFESILEEMASVDVENTTTSDLAHLYVDYKKQLIELSSQFKVEFTKGVSEEKREELKEKVEAKKEEFKEKRKEIIKNLQVKHSMKNLAKAYASIAELDLDELRVQFESGEITVDEIKTQLKESWDNLSEEEKAEAKEKLQEEKSRLQVEIKEKNQELREERKERIEILKEERIEKINEIKEKREVIKNEIRTNIQERRESFQEQRAARIATNQEGFKSIERKFKELTPEQQDKLKQSAYNLKPEQQQRLNQIAQRYLAGEELSEEDLAEIEGIVDTEGGVSVALE